MKELKCPKCGNVFKVDEADYASILNQVKTKEIEAEVKRRMTETEERNKAELALVTTKTEQTFRNKLSQKEQELIQKAAEIERLKGEKDSELSRQKAEMSAEIANLKAKLEGIESLKASELMAALSEKDKTISELKSEISQNGDKLQLALMEERNKAQRDVQERENKIVKLQSEIEQEKSKAQLHEADLQKQHENELRMKQEQIDYYKDLKTKMSTKMVGETLEQHCSIEFERYLRPLMPNAYFDKDNDASDGTKGDFIFRDSEDGTEYISIMFEMKNEMETTATKHKNEDFLKKLDEDRRKKGCEYAVLVSLLEADNELYNSGIVNKSHVYPKMYVIRPQFFVTFITLLVQASKSALEYKKQLVLAQNREVDVTNFETKMEDFKQKFSKHYELYTRKFQDAIADIDATIKKLQKVRAELVSSENNLRLATQDTENLTIRRLTYNNPTMKAKFDEARNTQTAVEIR
ncbi:DUF2130 domain-containing protein [Prevotella multiformis]|uniref:DUF2130 domain-containing protein n=1 Tax=Prevotella multiformis DSM 16608 TaxID=888743 RepID=F0F5F2_9BACT|nr:DUF2130 domain-containing protein [Prevotella multiformis]EGC20571.1 hypothetical protein HMPREF9141_0818 [Prevotella multiformis DSM 16608]QUB70888.1 DUF2130 domain-containing protein [Prevotella multiformis]